MGLCAKGPLADIRAARKGNIAARRAFDRREDLMGLESIKFGSLERRLPAQRTSNLATNLIGGRLLSMTSPDVASHVEDTDG